MSNGQQELRCFCTRTPLLAMCGIDKDKRLYVHVKVYKQNRIFAEIFHRGGVVELKCRECLRWHRITIKQDGDPGLVRSRTPEELSGRTPEGRD